MSKHRLKKQEVGGIDSVVDMIKTMDTNEQKQIIETVFERDPELAERISKKMVKLESLMLVSQPSLHKVLSRISREKLTLALKTMSENLRDHILGSYPRRMEEEILRDLESLGPRRLSEVQMAQGAILNVFEELVRRGEVVISDTHDPLV